MIKNIARFPFKVMKFGIDSAYNIPYGIKNFAKATANIGIGIFGFSFGNGVIVSIATGEHAIYKAFINSITFPLRSLTKFPIATFSYNPNSGMNFEISSKLKSFAGIFVKGFESLTDYVVSKSIFDHFSDALIGLKNIAHILVKGPYDLIEYVTSKPIFDHIGDMTVGLINIAKNIHDSLGLSVFTDHVSQFLNKSIADHINDAIMGVTHVAKGVYNILGLSRFTYHISTFVNKPISDHISDAAMFVSNIAKDAAEQVGNDILNIGKYVFNSYNNFVYGKDENQENMSKAEENFSLSTYSYALAVIVPLTVLYFSNSKKALSIKETIKYNFCKLLSPFYKIASLSYDALNSLANGSEESKVVLNSDNGLDKNLENVESKKNVGNDVETKSDTKGNVEIEHSENNNIETKPDAKGDVEIQHSENNNIEIKCDVKDIINECNPEYGYGYSPECCCDCNTQCGYEYSTEECGCVYDPEYGYAYNPECCCDCETQYCSGYNTQYGCDYNPEIY